MSRIARRLGPAALVGLWLLHEDSWLVSGSGSVLGLPTVLVYHVGFCLAVSLVMLMVVRNESDTPS